MTKLYLLNFAVSDGLATPTTRGTWSESAGLVVRMMAEGKTDGGASTTVARAEAVTTNPYDVLLMKAISLPLDGDQTVDGTLDVVLGVLESNAAADMVTKLHVYVMASDGSVRGTLLANYVNVGEWPTTAAGQALASAQALSSVAALNGDRIVAEIGYRATNAVATSYTGTLNYGGTGADLTVGSTSVTTQVGFLDFSDTLVLQGPRARTTQTLAEVLTKPGSDDIFARTTQTLAEILLQPGSGDITSQVSQLAVETLVKPDASENNARVTQLAVEVLVRPSVAGAGGRSQAIVVG